MQPVANMHVHLPPNFSAFASCADAVRRAASEGVSILGASNFHDLHVYEDLCRLALDAGVLPLYGIEQITLMDEMQEGGIRVNDPVNPGRAYLCGKGIDPVATPSPLAVALASAARAADEGRMDAIVALMRERLATAGVETDMTAGSVGASVAERAGVPGAWVVLQERHVAMAVQESIFAAASGDHRRVVLERVLGGRPRVASEDPAAVQTEIRGRLMKAGQPAFVPESAVAFADAHRLVLELGGIPCYPILADGADPVCEWEWPPDQLVERLVERGVFFAELIPGRNESAVVDDYVTTLRGAGIVVTAGTEHNTPHMIPLEPRCATGVQASPAARAVFWEGACVVAGHQHVRSLGGTGYVDQDGRMDPGFADGEERIRWFRDLGAELVSDRVAVR